MINTYKLLIYNKSHFYGVVVFIISMIYNIRIINSLRTVLLISDKISKCALKINFKA